MRVVKLTSQERQIEDALIKGEYADVGRLEFERITQAVAHRRKDAVLNIRVNSGDLYDIKLKAKRLGIRYQTFISELLHQVAHSSR